MNWMLIAIAVVLFALFIVVRVGLAISLGVLNLLWMIALLMLVIWGVRLFAD